MNDREMNEKSLSSLREQSGGGFIFFSCSPLFGEDSHFDIGPKVYQDPF